MFFLHAFDWVTLCGDVFSYCSLGNFKLAVFVVGFLTEQFLGRLFVYCSF